MRPHSRWRRLAELTEIDVVAGRLAEAHTDAVAILAELGGPDPHPDQLWGVWAAESRDAVLCAHGGDDEAKLEGTKVWCSGAGLCTHALVTARLDNGRRALFAVDLRDEAVRPLPSTWRNPGMAGSDTRSVQFSGAPAIAVGRARRLPGPARLLARRDRGRACWLGGARAVAAPLYERAADDSAGPHTLAHLGAVDAAHRRGRGHPGSGGTPRRRGPARPDRHRRTLRRGGPAPWSRPPSTRRSPAPAARSDRGRYARTPSTLNGLPI